MHARLRQQPLHPCGLRDRDEQDGGPLAGGQVGGLEGELVADHLRQGVAEPGHGLGVLPPEHEVVTVHPGAARRGQEAAEGGDELLHPHEAGAPSSRSRASASRAVRVARARSPARAQRARSPTEGGTGAVVTAGRLAVMASRSPRIRCRCRTARRSCGSE